MTHTTRLPSLPPKGKQKIQVALLEHAVIENSGTGGNFDGEDETAGLVDEEDGIAGAKGFGTSV